MNDREAEEVWADAKSSTSDHHYEVRDSNSERLISIENPAYDTLYIVHATGAQWKVEIWPRCFIETKDAPTLFHRWMTRILLGWKWSNINE